MGEKIVVGMSGGVDSSMSVLLLKKSGWEPVGVTLKLVGTKKSHVDSAKEICSRLKIRHYVYDASKDFKKKVMRYFDSEIKRARTPNPCIICNPQLKFLKLFEFANKHGIKYVATGHYAAVKDGKLLMPKDVTKDQTYGLCFLPKEWLSSVVFPLGAHTKEEIYRLAEKNGFKQFKNIRQSQDICFASGDLKGYLEKSIGFKPGFIKEGGKLVGEHKGLHFYTMGQKTLGYSVKGFDLKNNLLLVTKNRNELFSKEVLLKPFNFLSTAPKSKIKVMAKIRYRQTLSSATLYPAKSGKLKIVFNKPQEAITPGQCCVFYKGKVCLGGGIIL